MILCCGEALIDMIPANDGKAFIPHTGGSVFNTAIGLGRQGIPTGLLSGISRDLFGSQLHDALRESNVETGYLIRSDRPTTLAFVKLVDGKASYAFYDENTAGRMLSESDLPQHLSGKPKALFFGGISLAVEPCAEAYLEFLLRHSPNHLVMVDPNIRPSFITDEPRYRERLAHVLSRADIIKISEEDLDWISRSEVSREMKVQSILEQGPSLVCLTRDSEGALIFDKNGVRAEASVSGVKVVDTVGAGDAFNAGILAMLHRGGNLSKASIAGISNDDLQNALDFATAFATDTVTRPGSDPAWNYTI
ncbi:MAG: carbohydrate kinase [Pseudomonadota bacterium]